MRKDTAFFNNKTYICIDFLEKKESYWKNAAFRAAKTWSKFKVVEIKKSDSAQLEDKRVSFFLLGLILAFSVIFVSLQYKSSPEEMEDMTENFEDLAQDLEMSIPKDQKDMVSAEAVSQPAPKAITQEVKAVDKPQEVVKQVSTTTSELVIGDGKGAVDGANVKEAVPETPVDNANPDAQSQAPVNFTVVQKIPEFPGGWSAFMQWLTKNLKYPSAAQQNKIQGMVVVSFIVNKDGSVADVKLSTSVDPMLDKEALRVIRMMPKWKPGMDRNKVCRTMIAVPIVFKL